MKTGIQSGSIALCLVLGAAVGWSADRTWIGKSGIPWPWLEGTNWSGGNFPGEAGNAASANTDVATITNASFSQPIIQIDFSASGADGHLAVGAIVANRSQFALISTTVRPMATGGTLTLNGATLNGVPNTVLANIGTGSDVLRLGDAGAGFAAIRLGSASNVIQLGAHKWIYLSTLTERFPGSGVTVTSDTGESLANNSGGIDAGGINTFTGPVRIGKGTRWATASEQSLGLSPYAAENVILDNGALSGSAITFGRLFTLGIGGGRLETIRNVGAPTTPFAFTNPGAIAFEGLGQRTLTLAGESGGSVSYGTFAPAITDAPGGGQTSLVKITGPVWTLTGVNTYSGTTTIYGPGALELSGGGSFANCPTILLIDGSLVVSGVTGGANHDGNRFGLATGQTLAGSGTVTGGVSVRDGATLSPGLGVGTLQTRDLVFTSPNARLAADVELGGTPGSDLLRVWNAGLDLGGATLHLSLLNAPESPALTQAFLLIENNGLDPITNQFGQVILSGPNASGYEVTVDHAFTGTDAVGRVGDGNDVAITLAASSAPSLNLSLRVTNNVAVLTWPSVSNQTYWVQYKTALTNAAWDDLPGEVIATGHSASKTDAVGPAMRFYRVRTQ
jgi:hypothetical protein